MAEKANDTTALATGGNGHSLATYAVAGMDLSQLKEVLTANIGEGESLSPRDLDRIKIPAGGGTSWAVPTLEGEIDEKEIQGVVIYWTPPRAYWENDFTGESNPPDCYSDDSIFGNGKFGPGSEGNPSGKCGDCPMSKFGSSPKGNNAQACKQMRMLFMIRQEDLLPVVVTMPPTSIQPIKKYFLRLASKGVPYYGVVTKLSLEKTKNGGGITYSRAVPALAGILSSGDTEKMHQIQESLKPALSQVRIDNGGYSPEELDLE